MYYMYDWIIQYGIKKNIMQYTTTRTIHTQETFPKNCRARVKVENEKEKYLNETNIRTHRR